MSALPGAAQMPGASATAVTADRTFCGHCGKPDDGGGPAPSCRERCAGRLALEPPRYCAHCGRRMKVQITPIGWSAQCSRHEMLVR